MFRPSEVELTKVSQLLLDEVHKAAAKALGFELEKAIKSGTITVQQVDPAELSPR